MFCTGGIRCEKSTAFLRMAGFEQVYHLQGGILKYLETVPESDSRWEGECFVFDERVAIGHGLKPGRYELCRSCRIRSVRQTSPRRNTSRASAAPSATTCVPKKKNAASRSVTVKSSSRSNAMMRILACDRSSERRHSVAAKRRKEQKRDLKAGRRSPPVLLLNFCVLVLLVAVLRLYRLSTLITTAMPLSPAAQPWNSP